MFGDSGVLSLQLQCNGTLFSRLVALSVYLKIGSFYPAFFSRPVFNRENTVCRFYMRNKREYHLILFGSMYFLPKIRTHLGPKKPKFELISIHICKNLFRLIWENALGLVLAGFYCIKAHNQLFLQCWTTDFDAV